MNKVIVYKTADGYVCLCHPAPAPEGVEDADWLDQVKARSLPDGATDISVRDADDVPDVPIEALNADLTVDEAKLAALSVPASVSARQFKLQLLASGLLDQVKAWVATQDAAVQIAFENSGSFVRTEPMMQTGFAALGFTSEQIDAFFSSAAAL